MQLSQKMKHCVGYKINVHKRYMRRNPDAENPPSHSQNTRYLRGSLKLTPNFFLRTSQIFVQVSNDFKRDLGIESRGWGGGGLPIMGNQREAPPERGTFSGIRYMKGQGFYQRKYTKVQGNLLFWSVERPKRTHRCRFYEAYVSGLWFISLGPEISERQ